MQYALSSAARQETTTWGYRTYTYLPIYGHRGIVQTDLIICSLRISRSGMGYGGARVNQSSSVIIYNTQHIKIIII